MTKKVSVITPVYNDPEGIRDTLNSLPLDSDQADFIVVDNESTDDTAEIIKEFEYKYESVIHLYEPQEHSQFAARNTAIKSTDSEILAFVDADMMLPENWLSSVIEKFQSIKSNFMANSVELTLPDNPTFWSRYDYHTGFPVQQYIEQLHFAPTCCLVIGRSVFENVGLFDPRLQSGGDKEFGTRVYQAGYDLHFASDITMYHPTRDRLSELVNKASRVGRGHCQLQRCHPDRFGKPGFPPRPSGIKRPDLDLPVQKRLMFGLLSRFLTGARGLGYFREFALGQNKIGNGEIPHLET